MKQIKVNDPCADKGNMGLSAAFRLTKAVLKTRGLPAFADRQKAIQGVPEMD
jgi:hypothetical protein